MKKRQDSKPIYAAVPARAMGDEELSALDIRVLMVIAAHDRLGANGAGCFASHTRLSDLVHCALKSLSRSLRGLAESGYIEASVHPLNKKTRVYRVVYSDADAEAMRPINGRKGNHPVTDNPHTGNETGTYSGLIGNETALAALDIGNQFAKKAPSNQMDTEGNIFCEADNTCSKSDQIHPEKSASLENERLSDGQLLARIDRQLKDGRWTVYLLQTFIPMLEQIMERAEGNSKEYGQSERLLVRIAEELNPAVENLDDPF